uniref:Uncharacterized protein n=1 Tax=Oryza nivara TaxID=4536 RepID=A0A0E0IBH7_ORYNI
MSSLLWFQLGACTAGRVRIKDPSSETISTSRADEARKSRDSSILQQRLQSMSQALDFNVVINISHASHAAPTQMSGK